MNEHLLDRGHKGSPISRRDEGHQFLDGPQGLGQGSGGGDRWHSQGQARHETAPPRRDSFGIGLQQQVAGLEVDRNFLGRQRTRGMNASCQGGIIVAKAIGELQTASSDQQGYAIGCCLEQWRQSSGDRLGDFTRKGAEVTQHHASRRRGHPSPQGGDRIRPCLLGNVARHR